MTAKRIRFKGAVYRLAGQDYDLSLELLCADDFGAGYRDEDDWDEADRDHAENYQETRDKQHEVAELLGRVEIQVDVTDTDDRDSRHSDAYVRFRWSQLDTVIEALETVGITGDILDVPEDFPPDLADEIEDRTYWNVEWH